jgi:folylpolyglutamate synthase/dihydropteroate synthase
VYVRENVSEAFEFAKGLLAADDILFCAGSLYLVGELKELMGELK